MTSRASRIVCGVVAVACAAGAWTTAQRTRVPPAPVLATWEREHDDFYPLDEQQTVVFTTKRDEKRRDDVLWLLVGLAGGALATALAPSRTTARLGGPVGGVLVAAAVTTGLWATGRSLADQVDRARSDRWTLGDDALSIFASGHAVHIRELRERIPPDHAVITVGRRDIELNLAAWGLHPRPVYPLIVRPPVGLRVDMIAEELAASDLAAEHPGRWVLDLGRMALFSSYAGDIAARID